MNRLTLDRIIVTLVLAGGAAATWWSVRKTLSGQWPPVLGGAISFILAALEMAWLFGLRRPFF